MRQPVSCAIAVCVCAVCFAQTPAFDVASVKVSHMGGVGEGRGKQHLTTDPGRLTLSNFSLRSCVQWAYNVKDFQVSGPDWIDSERYDIAAKSAEPAKDDELRKMLQGLLADRFKLVTHREMRELPVYVMTVGKDGVKMKKSEGEGESNIAPVKGMGKLALSAGHTSMAQLADLLSQPLQRPVLDQTGLQGSYDFVVDLSRYMDLNQVQKGEGITSPIDRSSVESMILIGVREQLGLKLDQKKAPIDMIVIDKAEKAPTEN